MMVKTARKTHGGAATAFGVTVFLVMLAVLVAQTEGVALTVLTAVPLTGRDAKSGGVEEAVTRIAVRTVNRNPLNFFRGNQTTLSVASVDTESTVTGALSAVGTLPRGSYLLSSRDCDVAKAIAPIVESLGILHYTACPSESLIVYPHLIYMLPSERKQGVALADLVHRFNWDFTVGVLSSSSDYGAEILGEFIERADQIGLDVLSSQQFYPGTQELWQVVSTVKIAQARAIVNIMDVTDMRTVIEFGERLDMLTERYVWICSDACANKDLFTNIETEEVDEKLRR